MAEELNFLQKVTAHIINPLISVGALRLEPFCVGFVLVCKCLC